MVAFNRSQAIILHDQDYLIGSDSRTVHSFGSLLTWSRSIWNWVPHAVLLDCAFDVSYHIPLSDFHSSNDEHAAEHLIEHPSFMW